MIYDTTIHNNKKVYKNKSMIRKNYKNFSDKELKFLSGLMENIDVKNTTISTHAIRKNLLSKNNIKQIISNKQYKIIDYNYFLDNKEERILIRSKSVFKVNNLEGIQQDCYIKIVISITTNTIITIWSNRVVDEKQKQDTLNNKYCDNFDIINKKIVF